MPSYLETKANGNGEKQPQLVCVTGAGGFIGSWVVKEFLIRGYRVRGTARDPADYKNVYLPALEGARKRLSLCRADLLDRDNLIAVFSGCHGIFHIASPISKENTKNMNDVEAGFIKREGYDCEADQKNAHLLALEGAKERLSLCRADLLDRDNLIAVFSGCHGVFHIALPVSNTDPDLMVVAVEGTKNVINAAADAGVQRVVFTSSYGAVHMDPSRSPDAVLDESCWSDYEFCEQTGNLYCCAKMMAEITGKEEAAKRGLELAVVVPSVTIGPALQQKLNLPITHIIRYVTGAKKTYPNAVASYVDVREVARAHVLVYERPDARGRYLCIGTVVHRAHLVQLLGDLFPQYHIIARCEDDGKPMARPYGFSNQRLRDLGLEFTPLRESLYDTVVSLQQQGHLRLPAVPGPERARL